MENNLPINKYFNVRKLISQIVIINVDHNDKLDAKFEQLSEEIIHLISEGNKYFIIDVTRIDSLDQSFLKMLSKTTSLLNFIDGSIQLLVNEDRPIIKFSANKPLPKMDLHLSLESALANYLT